MRKKLDIVRFEKKHSAEARQLAGRCYLEECSVVSELPKDAEIPDPVRYDNGLGFAAYENGKMVGFLCCLNPFDGLFGTSKGTYVPNNAHGTVKGDRKKIYSMLYEAAADLWVQKGALSHAISVYAHDEEAIESFFHNGFGMRTIDAVRNMETIETIAPEGIVFRELAKDDFVKINPLRNKLISHLNSSPMFMPHKQVSEEGFLKELPGSPRRYFAAEKKGETIAYIKITDEGESFIGDQNHMANIHGAYMKEEYRGTGIYTNLLSYTIGRLKGRYSLLGVDCESFNPAARGFWLKYFTPYIYGLTRRIDERIFAFYE